jgi:PhzF family phenazine biosynthesis protein
MEFYIVDAFTNLAFGGNPAGVVIYENELSEQTMQKIATEVRFSETAFVKQIDQNTFYIRFFTPNSEVDLCGHATISSFEVLKHKKCVKAGSTYIMKTKCDKLPINVNEDFIMMEQSKPKTRNLTSNLIELCEVLGITENEMGASGIAGHYGLKPQIVSTGLWDIIFPVKSKEILNKINPNFEKLSLLSKQNEAVGLHAFTLDCENHTAECRNFAPLYDINEEAATGTSNGALAYYLFINNILKEDTQCTFLQGVKMERPSIITSIVLMDNNLKENTRVKVGGMGKILLKGELFI